MSEKLIIMSISVPPEMRDLLQTSGKGMKCSASKLVRTLVDKYLPLVVNDGKEINVILKIPSGLKGNEEVLRKWLSAKTETIVGVLKT